MSRLPAAVENPVRPDSVDANAIVTVLRVAPEQAGMRVDLFVCSELRRTSRTRAQAIVRASAFDGFGRKLRVSERVFAEQRICLWREPWDEKFVPLDLRVLYEDAHLLAVDKPPNLAVHPTARYHKNTLIKMLLAERPGQWLSLGHRLDKETSGVILVSKTRECDRALKKQLESRDEIEKTYLAITWGIPESSEFRVAMGMKLDAKNKLGVKMAPSRDADAMDSATRFTVLDAVTCPSTGRGYAQIACVLETGRQHQIRLHLATAGFPIVGDKLYGPDEMLLARGADGQLSNEDLQRLELPRHALHAHRLDLRHPITSGPLSVVSPLSEDLAHFFQRKREAAR